MLYSNLRLVLNQDCMSAPAQNVTHGGDVNMDKRKLTNSVARFTISSSLMAQIREGSRDV